MPPTHQHTELQQKLGLGDNASRNKFTLDQFEARLQDMPFQWPLKPCGMDKSLEKTAVVNKGAETRHYYMEQLEAAGLYDPRNPMGPLPTSLRPASNPRLQRLDAATVD